MLAQHTTRVPILLGASGQSTGSMVSVCADRAESFVIGREEEQNSKMQSILASDISVDTPPSQPAAPLGTRQPSSLCRKLLGHRELLRKREAASVKSTISTKQPTGKVSRPQLHSFWILTFQRWCPR